MNNPQVTKVLEEFGVATSALTDRAVKELAQAWAGLDHNDYEAMRAALLALYPQIAYRAALAQAGLSTAVYQAARAAQGITESYTAPAPVIPPTENLTKHVAYAVGAMYKTRDMGNAFGVLSGDMTKYAMDSSRQTMIANVGADSEQNPKTKPRWGIIPEADACDYCRKIGDYFQYRSAKTAQATFHTACRCDVVPEW